jgi:hypothetical protein
MDPLALLRLRYRVWSLSLLAIVLWISSGGKAQVPVASVSSAQTTIPVGANPYASGMNPVTNKLYVVNQPNQSHGQWLCVGDQWSD